MKNKFCKRKWIPALSGVVIYLLTLCAVMVFSVGLSIPDNQTYYSNSTSDAVSAVNENVSVTEGHHSVEAKLFGTIPVKTVDVEILPDTYLIPGGDVFGVKFFTKGVIVIGTSEIETESGFENPAETAGLCKSDIISKINGQEINTVEALAEIVEESDGKTLFVEYIHDGFEKFCQLTPVKSKSDDDYKTGIWVRDSTAGIGTVTYYDPKDKSFAGLGHGICDVDTGSLMPLLKGTVVDVTLTDIIKGKSGNPGELKGKFSTVKTGTLSKNTSLGIFGTLNENPDSVCKPLPVGSKNEVMEGKATILSNVDGEGIREYDVKLSKIDHKSDGTKCFVIEIVDDDLIELTGGIVQGMSGSPVIQNGKLIGAVTHVLVNEPTKGYGIFIENMLAEAEKNK